MCSLISWKLQVVRTQMKIFITAYRNYSNVFPQNCTDSRYISLTVKSNLSAKCLLAIFTKQLSEIPCSSTANSSHIGVRGKKKTKKKAVVSFLFPYNYGTVIVQVVQQAVQCDEGTEDNESESVEMS